MKTRLIFTLIAASLLAPVAVRAADEAKPAKEEKPKLAFIIAESLGFRTAPIDDFIRLDVAFNKVAEQRKWPVKVVMERFAANMPDYENAVTIFTQPIRQELPGEFTLRAWATLVVKGKKHDFGIVKADYRPYPGEWMDDALQKLNDKYANAVADKIDPILFPKEDAKPANGS